MAENLEAHDRAREEAHAATRKVAEVFGCMTDSVFEVDRDWRITFMNERARDSQVVAEFVAELDALLSRMLSHALSGHVPEEELPIAVESFRATVEGCFVKGLDGRARRRVLRLALERLMGLSPNESG